MSKPKKARSHVDDSENGGKRKISKGKDSLRLVRHVGHKAHQKGRYNPVNVLLSKHPESSGKVIRSSLKVMGIHLMGEKVEPTAVPWWKVRYEHSQEIRGWLVKNFSVSTGNSRIAVLKAILKECWKLGYTSAEEYQVASEIGRIYGETVQKGRYLPHGEIAGLFRQCKGNTAMGARNAAILAVLYGCGLRRAEVTALDLADYDRETGELVVNGKGRKERIAYLVPTAKAAVDHWIEKRGSDDGPLFLALRSRFGRLSSQMVFDLVRTLGKKAGIAPFTPHDLRRTYASDLLDSGADMITVSKLMGHSDPKTTAVYDRRGERSKKEASGRLFVPYQVENA